MSPTFAAAFFNVTVFLLITAGGLLWALAAFGVEAPARLAFDLLKWPIDGDPGAFDSTDRWFSALAGGFLTALGILLHLLVAPGIARGDREAKRAGLLALAAWFVVDSSGSIAAGAASNAAFNVPLLALLVAPILLARTERAA
jgi:hypothetical protein